MYIVIFNCGGQAKGWVKNDRSAYELIARQRRQSIWVGPVSVFTIQTCYG